MRCVLQPRAAVVGIVVCLIAAAAAPAAQTSRAAQRPAADAYFPDRFEWRTQPPDQVNVESAKLDEAIKFAVANESRSSKDLAVSLATSFGREPFDTPIGPVQPRGALSVVVVKNGSIIAEWGETARVDMTFSVTKSFLSAVVGLLWQKGLIRDVTDRVRDYMPTPELFDGPHNSKITWEHLLRQTSDWQGTLWGKPDWADRPEGQTPADWPNRPLNDPGTRYKYNDVRVNVLALAALHVARRSLPEILRDEIMEPIGASSTWRWYGYDNSWIDLDGRKVQSMTGGGHWGGGMFISGRDMARFGYLFLRNGRWKDRQLVSQKWIDMARSPGPANAGYGYMNWFLNSAPKPEFANAPPTAVTFQGNGSNIIYIDWQNDLVVVVRWIQQSAFNQFIGQVLGAVRPVKP
ncbi:MAG TPA: serine hydrolase [Vicinamibacterales bacterium]|nr:serine hydrolase [Vicinamibacterales bacterium]